MPRNLDLTALRAFLTAADTGGVTRAAGQLSLTQSAVSMQIKRLEEALDLRLFDRGTGARRLALTPEGAQVLGYARRMLALNDELLARLTDATCEGELRLGVPHDIVYPAIPPILARMAACYPRLRITLVSSFSQPLRDGFARGELDLVLTTEDPPAPEAEVLARHPLIWVGAPEGQAWRRRPLRLGFEEVCAFRAIALEALDRAGITWELGVGGRSQDAVNAMILADLALTARLRGLMTGGLAEIPAEAGLPALGQSAVCLRIGAHLSGPVVADLADQIRRAYAAT